MFRDEPAPTEWPAVQIRAPRQTRVRSPSGSARHQPGECFMREFACFGVGPVRFECSGQRFAVLCVLALALFMFSDVAFAADPVKAAADPFAGTALATALGSLVAALNGAIARSLAAIAVIGMGIAALTGRVEWSRAIVVVLGVGLIFSAAAMITALFPV
ncbi:hypothetical protein CAP37_01385 [Hydrogenophaga sp. IBVHS1]|nr:hypothetical protein CAP37_01385 [Hydrogenophaga sp. IBVHS1]